MTTSPIPAPLSEEELAAFMKSPGDAWENTQRETDDWLNSIAATITARDETIAGLTADVEGARSGALLWMTACQSAESRLERLEGALNIAAAQFRSYARSHADKKTVDGDAKSATNERSAKVCEAALASDPATTEPRT